MYSSLFLHNDFNKLFSNETRQRQTDTPLLQTYTYNSSLCNSNSIVHSQKKRKNERETDLLMVKGVLSTHDHGSHN